MSGRVLDDDPRGPIRVHADDEVGGAGLVECEPALGEGHVEVLAPTIEAQTFASAFAERRVQLPHPTGHVVDAKLVEAGAGIPMAMHDLERARAWAHRVVCIGRTPDDVRVGPTAELLVPEVIESAFDVRAQWGERLVFSPR